MCATCRRHLGFALWTWSGSVFVTSHGLCRRCVLHLRANLVRARAPAGDVVGCCVPHLRATS